MTINTIVMDRVTPFTPQNSLDGNLTMEIRLRKSPTAGSLNKFRKTLRLINPHVAPTSSRAEEKSAKKFPQYANWIGCPSPISIPYGLRTCSRGREPYSNATGANPGQLESSTATRTYIQDSDTHALDCIAADTAARTAGGSLNPGGRDTIAPSGVAGTDGRCMRMSCASAYRRSIRTCTFCYSSRGEPLQCN